MQLSHFNVNALDEILPGVFLGNMYSTEPKVLHTYRIRAVLNVATPKIDLNQNRYPLKDHLVFEIDDVPDSANELKKQVFPKAFQFLNKYAHPKSKLKTNVLIHCAAGVSRSATTLIGWLMSTFGMPLSSAVELLQSKRPIVNPNYGFMKMLREYEQFLKRYNKTKFKSSHQRSVRNPQISRFVKKPFMNLNHNLNHNLKHNSSKPLQRPKNMFRPQPISDDAYASLRNPVPLIRPHQNLIVDEIPNQWGGDVDNIWDTKFKL